MLGFIRVATIDGDVFDINTGQITKVEHDLENERLILSLSDNSSITVPQETWRELRKELYGAC